MQSYGCSDGGVAERFNAPVLKTGVRESGPRVRIPPPPLENACSLVPGYSLARDRRSCPKLDEIIRPRREPGGFPAFWAGALGGLAVDRMDPAIGVPE